MSNYQLPPGGSTPQYQQYQPSYAVQPVMVQQPQEDESVGSWMLTLFLLGLPLVGLIYLIVLAVGGGSRAKQNYARASLIWAAIVTVLSIIIVVLMVTSGVALFGGLSGSMPSTSYTYP